MAFDPNSLVPIGPPRPVARETLGIGEEQWQDTPASQKQMTQQFRGPDGKTYTAIIDPRVGKPLAFVSDLPGKEYERTFQNPQSGQWETQVTRKTGYNPIKDVLSDKKFMSFVAVAAGGVLASNYFGAGAAAGGGAAAPAAGTGAAPAAGGITGTQAVGGATAASSALGGSGSSTNSTGTTLRALEGGSDAVYGSTPAGLPPETWTDIAKNYGGDVLKWAAANPQLLASLGGAALGYLANKGDSTASSTTTTALDPTGQAQREHVISSINQFAGTPAPAYGAGRIPGPANWAGGAQTKGLAPAGGSPMAGMFGDINPFAGVQTKGTAPNTAPGSGNAFANALRQQSARTGLAAPGTAPAGGSGGIQGLNGINPYAVMGRRDFTPYQTGMPVAEQRNRMWNDITALRGGLSPSNPGPTMYGGPAGGNATPDWGASNAYMPQVQGYLNQSMQPISAVGNSQMGNVQNMIGQGTQQIGATGNTGLGAAQNYFNQGTGQLNAATNPLAAENNPYLSGMIDSAAKDMQKFYANQIAPKFASGSSFGNSGLGFLEAHERDNQADQFSQMVGGLRAGDHNLRAQLLEGQARSQDSLNSGARNNAMTAGQSMGGWGENFANRQDQLNNNRRNNALAGAGTLGQLGESQAGRQDILNSTQRQNALAAAGTMGSMGANAGQFNSTFDFNKWQAEQNEAFRRVQLLLQSSQIPGGTSVTNSTTSQGNPWAGAAGGLIAGGNLWNQWNKG